MAIPWNKLVQSVKENVNSVEVQDLVKTRVRRYGANKRSKEFPFFFLHKNMILFTIHQQSTLSIMITNYLRVMF